MVAELKRSNSELMLMPLDEVRALCEEQGINTSGMTTKSKMLSALKKSTSPSKSKKSAPKKAAAARRKSTSIMSSASDPNHNDITGKTGSNPKKSSGFANSASEQVNHARRRATSPPRNNNKPILEEMDPSDAQQKAIQDKIEAYRRKRAAKELEKQQKENNNNPAAEKTATRASSSNIPPPSGNSNNSPRRASDQQPIQLDDDLDGSQQKAIQDKIDEYRKRREAKFGKPKAPAENNKNSAFGKSSSERVGSTRTGSMVSPPPPPSGNNNNSSPRRATMSAASQPPAPPIQLDENLDAGQQNEIQKRIEDYRRRREGKFGKPKADNYNFGKSSSERVGGSTRASTGSASPTPPPAFGNKNRRTTMGASPPTQLDDSLDNSQQNEIQKRIEEYRKRREAKEKAKKEKEQQKNQKKDDDMPELDHMAGNNATPEDKDEDPTMNESSNNNMGNSSRRRNGGLNFNNLPAGTPVVPKLKRTGTPDDLNQHRRRTLTAKSVGKNWYNIMGVPKGSTQDDIRAAFHKLSQQYKDTDPETFAAISKAYAILGDPELRQLYHDGDLDEEGKVKKSALGKVKNYYNILGVPKDCSTQEIQAAYQELSWDLHPRNGGDPEVFQALAKAHQILSDPELRQHFDKGNLNEDGTVVDTASKIKSSNDYYDVLDLDPDCSPEDIKKAHQKLCQEHKGDTEAIQALTKAKEILMDPEMRQHFDDGDLSEDGSLKKDALHKSNNYYNILGVPKNATPAEIEEAYENLASELDPDNANDAMSFEAVAKAYDILTDDKMRQHFDNGDLNQDGSVKEHILAQEEAARKAEEEAAAAAEAARIAEEEAAAARKAKEEAAAAEAARKSEEEAAAAAAAAAARKAAEEAAAKKAAEEEEAARRRAEEEAAAAAKKAEEEAAARRAKEEAAAAAKKAEEEAAAAARKAAEEAAAKKAAEEAAARRRAEAEAKNRIKSSNNLYDVLDLDEDCLPQDIEKAYRRLCKEHKGDPEAVRALTKARDILSDPEMRQHFDEGDLDTDGSIKKDALHKSNNYYTILGVPKNASLEDIEEAYEKLAVELHPDNGGDAKSFEAVDKAFDILTDNKMRQHFDNGDLKKDGSVKEHILAQEEEAQKAEEKAAAKKAEEEAAASRAEKEAAARRAEEKAAAAARKAEEEAAAKKAKEEAAAKKQKEEAQEKRASELARALEAAGKKAVKPKPPKPKSRKPKSSGDEEPKKRGPPPPWMRGGQGGADAAGDPSQPGYNYGWAGDTSWMDEAGGWANQNSMNYEELDLETAYAMAPPCKWKTSMHKHDGRLGYWTLGKHKEYCGKSIKKAIEKFKANPHLYAGLSFQTVATSHDKRDQKYMLIERSGTYRLTANGKTGDKKKDTHTLWIHEFQQLRPYPDNRLPESDDYTSKMTYKGKPLPPPLLPGRGMGVGDVPLLKIIGDIDPSDISQGVVDDCWLLSAISSVAEFDGGIKKLYRKSGQYLDWMPFPDGRVNFYTISLYDLTTWEEVDYRIDESLCACPSHPSELLGSKPSDDGELWVPYLEKALAIHCGGWDQIEGGQCTHVWAMMTGCKEQYIFMRDKNTCMWVCLSRFNNQTGECREHFNSPKAGSALLPQMPWPRVGGGGERGMQITDEDMYRRMVKWDETNYIVAAGSRSDCKATPKGGGMVENHAYSVIDAHPKVAGTDIDLLWIRNPWGTGEIEDGDFDDDGPGWIEYPQIKEELNPVDADDGLFYVTKEEFFELFDHIYLSASDMTAFKED